MLHLHDMKLGTTFPIFLLGYVAVDEVGTNIHSVTPESTFLKHTGNSTMESLTIQPLAPRVLSCRP